MTSNNFYRNKRSIIKRSNLKNLKNKYNNLKAQRKNRTKINKIQIIRFKKDQKV